MAARKSLTSVSSMVESFPYSRFAFPYTMAVLPSYPMVKMKSSRLSVMGHPPSDDAHRMWCAMEMSIDEKREPCNEGSRIPLGGVLVVHTHIRRTGGLLLLLRDVGDGTLGGEQGGRPRRRRFWKAEWVTLRYR